MYQLLRGLGGAWERKSLQVTKFPQCKVRRRSKVWRGEFKAQPNTKTKPSSSTQVQAEVIQRCFQKKTFEMILGLLGERETGNWRMKGSGRGRSFTKLGGIFAKPGFECLWDTFCGVVSSHCNFWGGRKLRYLYYQKMFCFKIGRL